MKLRYRARGVGGGDGQSRDRRASIGNRRMRAGYLPQVTGPDHASHKLARRVVWLWGMAYDHGVRS